MRTVQVIIFLLRDKFGLQINGFVLAGLLFAAVSAHAQTNSSSNAFQPQNPPEMKPLASHATPAYLAAKRFQHGVNLANYLEAPRGRSWGVSVSAEEFALMKREGFDHVRVPIRWSDYAGPAPEFKLGEEIFARADFVATNALAQQLAVIVNIHHFLELDRDPSGQKDKFIALWKQIAAHYQKFPDTLAFELDNEPHDAATSAVMNRLYAQAIAEIRKTNPQRTIFVGPGQWNSIDELKNLVLPEDENIIVTVHCYDPFLFTHQGATWTGDDTKVTGIQFPGPPEKPLVPDPSLKLKGWVRNWIEQYNTMPAATNPSGPSAFENELKQAHAWSEYYGRPLYIGEFGAYTKADAASRARFYSAFRHACEKNGLGWAIWDWSSGFRYWDKKKWEPMPGLREALFEK